MSKLDDHLPEYFYKLIDGHSTHSKQTGKFWISLAIISILTIISSSGTGSTINLPFGIGPVSRVDFFPFALLAISIFIIGFGSSHIQAVRVTKLIHRVIKDNEDDPYIGGIHIQDFFDSVVTPSFNRVAPLGQILQGKYQFFPEAKQIPKYLKVLGYSYYLVLKFITFIVMYAFPFYALKISYSNSILANGDASLLGIPIIILKIFGIIGALVLLQLLIVDVLFVIRVTKRLLGLKD